MTWLTQIFIGLSVLVLIGSIVFVFKVTRDGGSRYGGGSSEESSPFSMRR